MLPRVKLQMEGVAINHTTKERHDKITHRNVILQNFTKSEMTNSNIVPMSSLQNTAQKSNWNQWPAVRTDSTMATTAWLVGNT